MKDAVSQNTNVAIYCKSRKSNMISLFKQNQLIKRHVAFIGNIIYLKLYYRTSLHLFILKDIIISRRQIKFTNIIILN